MIARRQYADTAYGWAMEDNEGFVKLIADPESRLLLGAHIMGAHASLLIQPLVQGMKYGQTIDEMARTIYIHPALTEVVEQALLEFPRTSG
jgi:mycothione reductase